MDPAIWVIEDSQLRDRRVSEKALQLRSDHGAATSVTNLPLTITLGVLCVSLGSRARGNDGGVRALVYKGSVLNKT